MADYQMAVYQDVVGAGECVRHRPFSLSGNSSMNGRWSLRVARHAVDNSVNARRSAMPPGASRNARRRSGLWWSVIVAIVVGGVVGNPAKHLDGALPGAFDSAESAVSIARSIDAVDHHVG